MQSSYDEKREHSGHSYAGFWPRFFAWLIDSVIVGCGLLVVDLLMSGVMSVVSGTILGGNVLFHYTLTDIVLYVAQVAYFILFTYYTGSTLGKRALNLRVVSAEEEESLSFWNVVYRETIGRFLCAVTLGIGYLFVAADGEKRGLHDMLCDTRVIYAKPVKVYPVYYGRNGKRVSGGMPSVEPEVYGNSEIPRMVPEEESTTQSGRDAMSRGDFGGYRMVRSEMKPVEQPEMKPVEQPENILEAEPDETGENGLTEGNFTSEDK